MGLQNVPFNFFLQTHASLLAGLTVSDVYNSGQPSNDVINGSVTSRWCPDGREYTRCKPELQHCYDRSEACVFDTRVTDEGRGYEIQNTCRDGSHLRKHCGK